MASNNFSFFAERCGPYTRSLSLQHLKGHSRREKRGVKEVRIIWERRVCLPGGGDGSTCGCMIVIQSCLSGFPIGKQTVPKHSPYRHHLRSQTSAMSDRHQQCATAHKRDLHAGLIFRETLVGADERRERGEICCTRMDDARRRDRFAREEHMGKLLIGGRMTVRRLRLKSQESIKACPCIRHHHQLRQLHARNRWRDQAPRNARCQLHLSRR